jgi:hypothetical protein
MPTANAGPDARPALARAVAGSYDLAFFSQGQEVFTLPAGGLSQVTLRVHVEDAQNQPATGGTVTFQYCSLKGRPPNDFDRADEAPSSACDDGSATWAVLGQAAVDGAGNAEFAFCCPQVARTVGFRGKYMGKGSGIANGLTDPEDFTWVDPT